MWKRTYFLLLLTRLYFALSSSYLHPDEHFQGPEIFAGRTFRHAVFETWEFTSSSPIRSIFPLWPMYGMPMLLLRSLWGGFSSAIVPPKVVFIALRLVMFSLSFVFEDWALLDLAPTRQQGRSAVLLVASSYVTWTWQAHTFSNAVETVVVLWTMVLVQRTVNRVKAEDSRYLLAAIVLSFLLVFGLFNRITFPAFVVIPLARLASTAISRRSFLLTILTFGSSTFLFAVLTDTVFYNSPDTPFVELVRKPIITPLNSLFYNTQPANLALHGTHPFYQHFLLNLPQLLGPAFPLIFSSRMSLSMLSALLGTLILSLLPHQEARFLLPTIPLILSSIKLPRRFRRSWISTWIIFNAALGILMGAYHQAGVIPAQLHLGSHLVPGVTRAYWWKTYSPPSWVLGQKSSQLQTVDLMGLSKDLLVSSICSNSTDGDGAVLVAPTSAIFLDRFLVTRGSGSSRNDEGSVDMRLEELWRLSNHLNLDDLDFGDDGISATLKRVVGRRGLAIWKVTCL